MKFMHGITAVVAGLAMTFLPLVTTAFSLDQAPGRLPKNVVPQGYDISVVPDVKALKVAGKESVALEVRSATTTIQFNSLNQTLRDVRLDGKPVSRVVSDDKDQLTTVTLQAPAAVGRHTLSFSYTGKIETEGHGLFAQKFAGPDGKPGLLLSTQMEATDARRMFPCWDEPAFRATFKLKVTVPKAWATVSNMPIEARSVHGALATTSFQRSPKMPTYLIELTAGNLAEITATRGAFKYGIWAVKGLEKNGATALANAQTILADYNDYFGYPFPLPKLDSIAVPGGFQGAMENWGAITYNDQTLLLSENSTIGNRQTVFSIQAHEMAHQWNGDLVTMAWWDDIWLNESFASWMAAKETALRNPDWKWWEDQDEDKEGAMGADARASSHPIQQHVTNELQANNSFDPQITYSKGQAMLRMMEAYLGPDVFREGVRTYMRDHAYSNATTSDLWVALNKASGQDVGAVAAGWTEKAGFPLVDVVASCDGSGQRTLTLSQRRFILDGPGKEATDWKIPLQMRVGAEKPRAELLTRAGQTESAGRCDEPVSVNADALGYYRTHYDSETLALNTRKFGTLPDADRIALLDDQWALVESGVDPLPSYLALASSMGSDLDSRAWTQIATALETIEYDERGTPGHDAFTAYARSILQPAFERLGWDSKPSETPDVQLLRRRIVRELGAWDDPRIVEEARKRFSLFVANHKSVVPDDQAMVLAVVAEHANAATFDELHSIARSSKDETELRRYYGALMQVRDAALAKQAAQIALSDEIPAQADALRYQMLARLGYEHPVLAWKELRDNSERLMKPFPGYAPLIISQYIPEQFWSVPTPELESWVRAHVPAEMGPNVDRGMETVRFRVAEKDLLVRAADKFVRG